MAGIKNVFGFPPRVRFDTSVVPLVNKLVRNGWPKDDRRVAHRAWGERLPRAMMPSRLIDDRRVDPGCAYVDHRPPRQRNDCAVKDGFVCF